MSEAFQRLPVEDYEFSWNSRGFRRDSKRSQECFKEVYGNLRDFRDLRDVLGGLRGVLEGPGISRIFQETSGALQEVFGAFQWIPGGFRAVAAGLSGVFMAIQDVFVGTPLKVPETP